MDNIRSKILNGTATEKEKQEFYSSLQANSQERKDFINLKTLFSINQATHQSTSIFYKRARFKMFWKQTNKPKWKLWTVNFAKYAAVFALALLLSQFIKVSLFDNKREAIQTVTKIQSQKRSINTFELSDGSKVWLNANSEITLLSEASDLIELKLEGEAFFEIPHNENRSFIVEAGGVKVVDIGTKFNINSFPSDQKMTTTLVEGEVNVIGADGNLIANLAPGDHLSYDIATGEVTVDTIDVSLIKGWVDGKFVFVNNTFGEIAKELENWYGVEIHFTNPQLIDERFSGVFYRSKNIRQILHMLSFSAGISYSINEKDNGKEEIVIK